MKLDEAQKRLHSLGIRLSYCACDYRVNFLRGNFNTEQITDDLEEAIRLGEEMARAGPPKTPFVIGPLPRNSLASRIRSHNLRRLKRHLKKQGKS